MPVELPEKFVPLAPWFERHRRDAWLPVVEDGDGEAKASKFGGSAWLPDGEDWPACGMCGKPMALFLQLDLAASPHVLHPELASGLLQAFFCIEYDCVHGEAEGNAFAENRLLRVIDPAGKAGRAVPPPEQDEGELEEGLEGVATAIPPAMITGWERVDDYPSMSEAEEDFGLAHGSRDKVRCTDPAFETKATIEAFCDLPWARDGEKFAGWPAWANITVDYPMCPECGARMDLVIFQFGYEGCVPIMFGDGGQGHLVACPNHPRVLAYPWTCG